MKDFLEAFATAAAVVALSVWGFWQVYPLVMDVIRHQ